METLEAIGVSLFFRMMVNTRGNLQQMTPEFINSILPFFAPAYIHANTVIMKPGDTSICSLLIVLEGRVRLVTDKYELIQCGPGDWFGGEALIEGECGYTAIAEEDTVCLSLNASSKLVDRVLNRFDRYDEPRIS